MSKFISNPMKLMAVHNDQRRSGRLDVKGIDSASLGQSLGEILNLSTAGILILRRKKLQLGEYERLLVRLTYNDYEVEVYVRIAWSKRIGFRKHLFGLSFNELNERDQMILNKIAMQAGAKPDVYANTMQAAG